MATDHQFEAPDAGKAGIAAAKQRLIEQRLRGVAPPPKPDCILARPRGTPIPMSAEQRRIWLHASHHPDLPVYNEPVTIHRHGPLDLPILEASFNEIVRRHEAWRTSITSDGNVFVHESLSVKFPFVDLTTLPVEEREESALCRASRDARSPVQLGTAPLFRGVVVRMAPQEHRLYLTFHHIIFDGVSISRIFLAELSAIYAAFEKGEPSPLPMPALQYGDYALWREGHVESPAVQRHLAYWTANLSGELPVLQLPRDRSEDASNRGAAELFRLPADLLQQVRALCSSEGVTLYMALLAAFQVLLFRYSGQNDLIVGSVTDGRRRPELAGMIGCLLDTFAIRTRPTASLPFTLYLAETRKAVLSALWAAEIPFDRVVQEIRATRDPNDHPIFQAFVAMHPPVQPVPDGWNVTTMDVSSGATKFKLYLELSEHSDDVEARLLYSADNWDETTIKRMIRHWLVLIESICRDPQTPIGALRLLSDEEIDLLLGPHGWNDTVQPLPQVTLDILFETQVEKTPDAIACVFEGRRWSYRDLNERADALAWRLQSEGVGKGSVVAVALDRSLDLVAGLLAVLKSGATYLPLDIRMPSDSIQVLFVDAEPTVVLTQSSVAHRLPPTAKPFVLADKVREQPPAPGIRQRPGGDINPEDTAYLIYTSGTTGVPKGVEISHRSLVNLLVAMQAEPGFSSDDVLLAVTPVSFDIAALELFLPLISGGTVVIISREAAQDPQRLAKTIASSNCTVMQATPATWQMLLQSGWNQGRVRSARQSPKPLRVLCGGEALSREMAQRLLATGAEVWNMYGPTETTIWSTIHRVQPMSHVDCGCVPVGVPIANTAAFILDKERQLLPVGVPGELFLGGVGLAKGYRGQPQLTADRFVRVESSSLLYRTGDVAVRNRDGTIVVLGRMDNLVKVRGHRVELEAVEAAVLLHPHIALAVARVWPDATGSSRVVAYVVARSGFAAPNITQLSRFLRNRVPGIMIPSDVIPLPEIPLTPHGKVDRERLPAPADDKLAPASAPPSTPLENRISSLWADLLHLNSVEIDDNFFDLGGHSLLVAALQHRLTKEFGQNIPVADLYYAPTVRKQAALLRREPDSIEALPQGMVALQATGAGRPVFWIHYLNDKLAQEIGNEHPFYVVTLTAEELSGLGKTPRLETVAAHQMRKILTAQPQGPYTLGGQCVGGALAYEIARQLQAAGSEVSLLVLIDVPNPAHAPSCHSLEDKLNYCRYLLNRFVEVGPWKSLAYITVPVLNNIANALKTKSARTDMRVAQLTIEAAASAYRPDGYDGNLLLVVSTNHAPHRNLLPGWQATASRNFHTLRVAAHHRDILEAQNSKLVAQEITRLLKSES